MARWVCLLIRVSKIKRKDLFRPSRSQVQMNRSVPTIQDNPIL